MFGQPRCREWTPLATQQLRLRSLIQIVGYNVHVQGGECCGSLYYTLHSTTMSAPFYTSEKVLSQHPKWREIDSELIHKMSAESVVVRVWQHSRHTAPRDRVLHTWGVAFSGLLHVGTNLARDFCPGSFHSDTLVFQMTGGYFCPYESLHIDPATAGSLNIERGVAVISKEMSPSRKIPIDKRQTKSARSNESKSVSPGRGWRCQTDAKISKSQSPPKIALSKSGRFTSYLEGQDGAGTCENIGRERSNFHSIFKRKNSNKIEIIEYSGNDDNSKMLLNNKSIANREFNVDESETAVNLNKKIVPISKCRYLSMNFLKSEVRPSYTAGKLQMLHHLQYLIKKRTQAVQEIKEKIYKKSAMESCEPLSPHTMMADNEDFSRSEKLSMSCREFSLLTGKNRHSSRSNLGKILSDSKTELCEEDYLEIPPANLKERHIVETTPSDRRFTLPLNKLLESKSQVSPGDRLRYAVLTRAAELSRFKRRLLQDERDRLLAILRQLSAQLGRLTEENQDSGTELMQYYHSLNRNTEQLRELKKSEITMRDACARYSSLLYAQRWRLVQDIQLLYPIHEVDNGKLTILGTHLPACRDAADRLPQCGEAALAVALGRAAHATELAARALGLPLRHSLLLAGSRSKVLDHRTNHIIEIPLFARNKNHMMFCYGLFLLNNNIAQLLWSSQYTVTLDPRNTLDNLQRLLQPPIISPGVDVSRMFGSASSMETLWGGGMHHPMSAPALGCVRRLNPVPSRPFNRFKDSIDGHRSRMDPALYKHRYSRSVGSYVDEQSLQSLEMCSTVIGSEPSLLHHDSTIKVDGPIAIQLDKIPNVLSFSESDLTKVINNTSSNQLPKKPVEKVTFSLGEDFQTFEAPYMTMGEKQSDAESSTSIVNSKGDTNLYKTENNDFIDEINKLILQDSSGVEETISKIDICKILDDSTLENNVEKSMNINCSFKNVEAFNSVTKNDFDDHTINIKHFCSGNAKTECLSSNCCPIDIEKLSYPPFCGLPCTDNCPRLAEGYLHTGYDQCENGEEIMRDVIVLPSAEAVMSSSLNLNESFISQSIEEGLEITPEILKSLHQDSLELKEVSDEELMAMSHNVPEFEGSCNSGFLPSIRQKCTHGDKNVMSANETVISKTKQDNLHANALREIPINPDKKYLQDLD